MRLLRRCAPRNDGEAVARNDVAATARNDGTQQLAITRNEITKVCVNLRNLREIFFFVRLARLEKNLRQMRRALVAVLLSAFLAKAMSVSEPGAAGLVNQHLSVARKH